MNLHNVSKCRIWGARRDNWEIKRLAGSNESWGAGGKCQDSCKSAEKRNKPNRTLVFINRSNMNKMAFWVWEFTGLITLPRLQDVPMPRSISPYFFFVIRFVPFNLLISIARFVFRTAQCSVAAHAGTQRTAEYNAIPRVIDHSRQTGSLL